ncbi:hypothetical protein [Methanoculleus sp.]|uniref:hypothetical protein n=1 Tax=Methanoculleus sp. TaxID=90427 RepID=UPI00260139F3|nr:hypothetical protein [Methanoculleus sp.]MCK9319894.1 hypothetical protein [Methanoculleus sp.]
MTNSTFEQLYAEYLKTELAEYLSESLTVSNDITYKPLYADSNKIVVVIKTGSDIRPQTPDNDMTTANINISFIMKTEKTQAFILAMLNFINDNNAISSTLSPYTYKPLFNMPSVISEGQLKTNNETVDVSVLYMTMQVVYGQYISTQDTLSLIIGSKTYLIKGILSYEFNSMPTNEISVDINSYQKNSFTTVYNVTYTMTILRIAGDTLHELFMSEFTTNYLDGKTLSIIINETTVAVADYTLQYTYQNNVATFILTLMR